MGTHDAGAPGRCLSHGALGGVQGPLRPHTFSALLLNPGACWPRDECAGERGSVRVDPCVVRLGASSVPASSAPRNPSSRSKRLEVTGGHWLMRCTGCEDRSHDVRGALFRFKKNTPNILANDSKAYELDRSHKKHYDHSTRPALGR
jgi:hypothetical protein